MKRGEIWTVSGGPGYAGKPRPTVIVQADVYATDSVTVCGLTATDMPSELMRPLIEPAPANGLQHPSRIMVDKITTVPRSRLGYKLGSVSDDEAAAVDRALLLFLGLAS